MHTQTSTITINGQSATLKTWRTINCSGWKASITSKDRTLCYETESCDTRREAANLAKSRARRR